MEDIRFNKDKKKYDNIILFAKLLIYIKKNWWKILIVILLIFVISFPTVTGHLLGSWWNNLVTSFLEKLTF